MTIVNGYQSLCNIMDVKGNLLTMYNLKRSVFLCNFIEYYALKIKNAKGFKELLYY